MGLVETGVGLVPAGGGCKEVLWRWSQTAEAKEDPDFAVSYTHLTLPTIYSV